VGAPLALAIGNFDGMHIGHAALLARARAVAEAKGLSPAVLTFMPTPREYFSRQHGVTIARLSSMSEKLAAFHGAGIEHVFLPRFDTMFASQSAAMFLTRIREINVRHILVGRDFRFGHGREGQASTISLFAARHGLGFVALDDVTVDDSRVSSTAIRAALAAGDLARATRMLGGPYRIVGRVTHGKKLGRTLGYPTANVTLSRRHAALSGVFAVKLRLVSTRGLEGVAGDVGDTFDGVANLGTNPVVSSESRQHLEVFLFDFNGDLYGKRVEVTFIEKIRDELTLPSLDALIMHMRDDEAKARSILSRMNDERAD
jgi:riboflavin kinase/FMN adenylyltransferase